jgi:ubiquinone biosynthesis protein UbiJ
MPNPLHDLHEMVAPALMERLTLLTNHVLWREPAALDRLRPHAGRVLQVQVEDWPALLPPWPRLAFRVSPAGLLEWCGPQEDPLQADLRVRIATPNPARTALALVSGRAQAMQVEGDAEFAAAVQWLADNLRWDLADELHRLLGPGPAQALATLAAGARQALSSLARRAADAVGRGGATA